ncbi:MAG: imidazole glycerol phosphate synthase subunit HisH [Flavobacteriales bacterium]|jgi:glutamine amidotransferase|nr:imidazole glycerol phosphate synthase subunit HisH [Flavobacteriales bacterium]
MKIVIIDYGAGNVYSVMTAIERLGYKAVLSSDKNEICTADKVIFPGVGQASSALAELKNRGLDKVLPTLKVPVLGICLGMQMMCAHSQEGGGAEGLGIFPMTVRRFVGEEKIPHMGWNDIYGLSSPIMEGVSEGKVYFVHSYYVEVDDRYTIARCDYMGEFSAAIKKDNFYGVQFHPEKSAAMGEMIIKNFLEL